MQALVHSTSLRMLVCLGCIPWWAVPFSDLCGIAIPMGGGVVIQHNAACISGRTDCIAALRPFTLQLVRACESDFKADLTSGPQLIQSRTGGMKCAVKQRGKDCFAAEASLRNKSPVWL